MEHVPNPEQAFAEARRVIKPGGVLYLEPAWSVSQWAADGYPVRPYSDFGIVGKMIKASLVLRADPRYRWLQRLPPRIVRSLAPHPTRLRYHRLTPNYEKYWMNDSDAINSIDSHEAALWFLSRGDDCLNCNRPYEFMDLREPLIIRVHKGVR